MPKMPHTTPSPVHSQMSPQGKVDPNAYVNAHDTATYEDSKHGVDQVTHSEDKLH